MKTLRPARPDDCGGGGRLAPAALLREGVQFMTLLEALRDAGVDTAETLRRFSGNEALLERFIRQFPKEETFPHLVSAVRENRWEEAGRLAHTLKGIAGNLGFRRLQERCAALVLTVRENRLEEAPPAFEAVSEEYGLLIGLLGQLD